MSTKVLIARAVLVLYVLAALILIAACFYHDPVFRWVVAFDTGVIVVVWAAFNAGGEDTK